MHGITVLVIVIFIPLVIINTIRFLIQYFRKRKALNTNPDLKSSFSDTVYCCCECLDCFTCNQCCCSDITCCISLMDRDNTAEGDLTCIGCGQEGTYTNQERQTRKNFDKRMEQKSKEKIDFSKEEEKLMKLIYDKEKVSLWWLNNNSKIPAEMIKEMIERNPNYFIERDYVINKGLILQKQGYNLEEIGTTETEPDRSQLLSEGICPYCKSPFKEGTDFCPNCGVELK